MAGAPHDDSDVAGAAPPGGAARRPVLVAGGTGALGSAVLRALLDAGHPVVATWLVESERDRIAEQLAGEQRFSLVRADLTDPADVAAAVTAADGPLEPGGPAARHGPLGAVVDLVGGYAAGPLVHETDPEAFEAMLRLNLRPAFLLARAAMPRLVAAGGGAFVAVSARAAVRPFPGAAGYVTAKAALLAFVRALDTEYRDAGVRCNAVLPSVIDTPANRQAQPGADVTSWVPPAQVAAVVRFLVSAESAPVSGAGVPVYGRA